MQHKAQIRDELINYRSRLEPRVTTSCDVLDAFDYGVIAALSWVLGWCETPPRERHDTLAAKHVHDGDGAPSR